MVEHIHYKMLGNLILHITYLISRLHASINKRIASLFEMIAASSGARKGPSRSGRFCIPFTDAKPAREMHMRRNHLDGDGRKN